MKTSLIKALCVAAIATLSIGSASAASKLGQTVDSSLIFTVNGYDWVYASPCSAVNGCSSIQLSNGFNFANDAQWNASFSSLAALSAAFVPSQRCASAYFDVNYDHCDYGDISSGWVWNSPLAVSPASWSETFLVRPSVQQNDVPEPASVALLGMGLLGLIATRRKQNA